MRSEVRRSFVPVLAVVLFLLTAPAFAAGPRNDDADISVGQRVLRIVKHLKAFVLTALDDNLSTPKP